MRRLALVLCLLPGVLLAQEASQRPRPRPPELTLAEAPTPTPTPSLRPKPRPWGTQPTTAQPPATPEAAAWPRPRPRPAGLVVLAAAPQAQPQPQPQKQAKPGLKGAVCGIPTVKGRDLPPMRSTTNGCGIANPVEVSSVAGVTLSPPATINCAEAGALNQFVGAVLQPAFSNQIKTIRVADSYSCRHRNNLRSGPISVHGKGDAVDLQAVVLTNGQVVEVKSRLDRRWQRARKNACGIFTVILGPGSDGYHENHIHFDVSQHGGNPYCR